MGKVIKAILKILAKIILAIILVGLIIGPVSLCCRYVLNGLIVLWNMLLAMCIQVCGGISNIVYGYLIALVDKCKGNVYICDYFGLFFSACIVGYLFFRAKHCIQMVCNVWSRVRCFKGRVGRFLYAVTSPLRKVLLWHARQHMATSRLCRWLVSKQRARRYGCDFNIRMLTPIDTAKNLDCYNSMFTKVLKDSKITNIAVTGRYGAGKSTFLQTYFNGYTVLWVSLASFIGQLESSSSKLGIKEGDGSIGKDDGKDAEYLTTRLEWSILQQVIYAAHGNHLPFSRFTRIAHYAWHISVLFGLFATLLVICSIVIFQPDRVFSEYNSLSDGSKVLVRFISFALGLFVLMPLVFVMLHRWFIRRNPHVKVETPAFGVDLTKGEGVSVFNRALDELIYFFERLHYDAVIFEDIDRLDQPLLFMKLREINHILNNTKQIPQSNKPIRFIYAVRDDLFAYDERVKFFDFIMPIFPEFNAEKSNGFILEDIRGVLGPSFVMTDAWDSFIRLFSYYISDRRLWNNIYNEFALVHNSASPHLDRKKLLAMILFKNLFPRDYDLAHSRTGILPYIFGFYDGHTKNWRSKQSLRLHQSKDTLHEKYEALKDSGGSSEDMDNVKEELSQNSHLQARLQKFPIGTLMKFGDFSYEAFVQDISEMLVERCDKAVNERDGRLLLLFRLIENGMIDEQYEDYLTNTPDGAMSAKDFLFMHTLLEGGDVSNLDLDRPSQIIDQLNRNVFRGRVIRNVKFAQGLIGLVVADRRDIVLQGKFDNYIAKNFARAEVDAAIFLCELLVQTHDMSLHDIWIVNIHACSPKFLERVLVRTEISEVVRAKLLGYCIGFLARNVFEGNQDDYSDLMAISADSLSTLARLDKVVNCSNLSDDDFCDFLKENKIFFKAASFFRLTNTRLRELILSMGLYVPTPEIILSLLKYRGMADADGKIKAPCQAIMESGDSVLKMKVLRDVSKFLQSDYDKILNGEKGVEPSHVLLDLLKRDDIPMEQKAHLLKLQKKGCITLVDDLNEDVVRLVLDEGMLLPVWKSVVNAYQKVGYISSLRAFVVKYAAELCKDDFSGSSEDAGMQCVNEILRDTETSDSVILRLAQSINRESRYWYSSVDFPPGRLAVLCKSKLIRFSSEGYEKLRTRGDGSHLILARYNIKKFLDDFQDSWLGEEDAVSLLSSGMEHENRVGVLLLRKAIGLIRRSDVIKKLLASIVRMRDFESKTCFTKEMMIEVVDYMESPTCRVYTLLMMKNLTQDAMWKHLMRFPGGIGSRGVVSMQVSTKVANRINDLLIQLGFETNLSEAKRMPKLDVWRKP